MSDQSPTPLQSAKVIATLEEQLAIDPELSVALTVSLLAAQIKAYESLNADLYNALNDVFYGNGWPTTPDAYLGYLAIQVRLIPNESTDPRYPDAWTTTIDGNGYNQKVFDILCHFYWLIDQALPGTDKTLQHYVSPVNGFKFADWLVDFANAWGDFLDTPESLTPESLSSFKYDAMYNFPLYEDNEPSWQSFNDFFSREFNAAAPGTGITPLRPIAEPTVNTTITAPADCTFHQAFPIDSSGNVLDETGEGTTFRLKHTHSIGNINELLDGSPNTSSFYGGTFVHYFLGPFDYHRFHTPVGGTMIESRNIAGQVYLDVTLQDNGEFDAPDNANDGYEFNQSRGLIIVDTGMEVGKVAVLPIGMAQVSGVNMYTQLQGQPVVKGQEFGLFKFGGSDIIMLFEPGADLYLWDYDPGHIPIHFQYGQVAAYWGKGVK